MISYNTQTRKGFGRGKTLGFPTVNMDIPKELTEARRGIYAARITIGDVTHNAALYFGPPITFGVTTEQLEAYLIDTAVSEIEPGTALSCTHVAFIRDVQTFPDSQSLIAQMHDDVASVRRALTSTQHQQTQI